LARRAILKKGANRWYVDGVNALMIMSTLIRASQITFILLTPFFMYELPAANEKFHLAGIYLLMGNPPPHAPTLVQAVRSSEDQPTE
jgi:hypothetical protein